MTTQDEIAGLVARFHANTDELGSGMQVEKRTDKERGFDRLFSENAKILIDLLGIIATNTNRIANAMEGKK